ncbi:phosphoribosylaminoimidazolesuccinocarboxamide synthase [Candidatus Saccharibacteria bacterium]|nr:phosphoribosylaminoimidazolesuccinocarboxamide synthase [Candidatus Saccharibacteria bacterium]
MNTIDLPLLSSNKVRDVYDAGDGRLLLVTSDRLSAFDVVMNQQVKYKGIVLNLMSEWWFNFFGDTPNHMITTDLAKMPPGVPRVPELKGRVMLCRKAEMLPIECIVRGYITGSGWKDYKRDGAVCGHQLPEGLLESQKLPETLFTPSTKFEAKDRNIELDEAMSLTEERFSGRGESLVLSARTMTTNLYEEGAEWAAERGIIIADTKFEVGVVDGELTVCDEILTPDSSRFWPADQWVPGTTPPSFDKQPVRDHLDASDWDKEPPPPDLPDEVVEATSGRYVEAYKRITGSTLPLAA